LPLHFPHRNKFGVLDHLERRLLVDRFALILAIVLRHHLRKSKDKIWTEIAGDRRHNGARVSTEIGEFFTAKASGATVIGQSFL
jgi:hypothetical protein